MWSEISNIDYDQAVRSTAWYDIVSRRRDQDLERQLCQAASGHPWLRSASGHHAGWQDIERRGKPLRPSERN